MFKFRLLASSLELTSILSLMPAHAETPFCKTELKDGAFSALIEIKEFYPGSELQKQTIRMDATPEKMALSEDMRQKTIGQREIGKINADVSFESDISLKDKNVLRDNGWDKLDLTLTLIRLPAGKWYHKTCKIDTESYTLVERLPFEGDYQSTCSLKLNDEIRDVIAKEPYLEWQFSGNENWKPLFLRLDLSDFNAFLEKIETAKLQQRADFEAGKCQFVPFSQP